MTNEELIIKNTELEHKNRELVAISIEHRRMYGELLKENDELKERIRELLEKVNA